MAPKGRRMEMSRITRVQLFTEKLERPRTMVIDDVELVRESLGSEPQLNNSAVAQRE